MDDGSGTRPVVLMATVDGRRRISTWSAGARAVLGHSPADVLGRPADTVFTAAVDEAFGPPGREWHGRAMLRHRDGLPVPAEVDVLPAADGDRGPRWLVVAVPYRESAPEWALAQCELPVALFDPGLRLVWASRGLLEAIRRPWEASRARPLSDVAVRTGDGDDLRTTAHRVMSGGPPASLTVRFLGDPASPRTWSATLTALRGPAGEVCFLQLLALDTDEPVRSRRRFAALSDVNTRVGSTLEVTRTAQEMADVLVEHVADYATVDLLDDTAEKEGGTVALRRAAHASVLPGVPEPVSALGDVDWYPADSPPARCLATGRSSLHQRLDAAVAAWTRADPARAESIRDFGIHSIMVVPLRARDVTLGVSVMVRHRHSEPFEEEDLLLAEEIAGRAALSIDNARRYRDARATALTLQRSLLPQPPTHQEAVDIAFRYRPASSRAGVGGDWFDVVPLPGARVALVVGDVVGHGLHASVAMARLRTAVRTLADIDLAPDELLTHLDDLVTRLQASTDPAISPDDGTVATCLYAVYDPTSKTLAQASAGHPLPLLTPPGAPPQQTGPAPGPPLGVGGLPFEKTESVVPEGTLITLFTDGLLSGGEQADRMRELCAALTAPAASLDALCDRVMRPVPEQPKDDIALLVARTRVLPDDSLATLEVPPDPATVAGARVWTRRRLQEWHLEDVVFTAELVVSELLTNAIRHAAPPIRLRLIRTTRLICEVWDASSASPHLRRARTFDEGGRGLLLVAQLADGWGSRHVGTGKVIWAEIVPS